MFTQIYILLQVTINLCNYWHHYVPENKTMNCFESIYLLIGTEFYEKNQNSLTEPVDFLENT